MKIHIIKSISFLGIVLVLLIHSSCAGKTSSQTKDEKSNKLELALNNNDTTPVVFNGMFFSLEKFYGNIDSIEFTFYCQDQTFDKAVYNADTINGKNLIQIVGKDMVRNGKKVPMLSEGTIVFQNNIIHTIEYKGAGTTRYEFLYANGLPTGYSSFVMGKISEIYEVTNTDEKGRVVAATLTGLYSSSTSIITKKYSYNTKGQCNEIVQSEYYSSKYQYNDNGFITEDITVSRSGEKSTTYNVIETDKNNNWTKRLVKNHGPNCDYIEERMIYYSR